MYIYIHVHVYQNSSHFLIITHFFLYTINYALVTTGTKYIDDVRNKMKRCKEEKNKAAA